VAHRAEQRAAEAHWHAASAADQVQRDADVAFQELERRQGGEAVRLRLRLQAAEDYQRQQAQHISALRGSQTRAAQVEAQNEQLRLQRLSVDQATEVERAKTQYEAEAYARALAEMSELQARLVVAEAGERRAAKLEEANAKLKAEAKLSADRASKIEWLQQSNAQLRQQLKEAKEASPAPRKSTARLSAVSEIASLGLPNAAASRGSLASSSPPASSAGGVAAAAKRLDFGAAAALPASPQSPGAAGARVASPARRATIQLASPTRRSATPTANAATGARSPGRGQAARGPSQASAAASAGASVSPGSAAA